MSGHRAGGNEDEYVSAETDDGLPRTKWECRFCPLKEECSRTAFKRAKLYSWKSEACCREYVSRHLHSSSRHKLGDDKQRCDELAQEADCKETVETFEDREENRAWYKEEKEQAIADNWAAVHAMAALNQAGKREAAAADAAHKNAKVHAKAAHSPPHS